VTRIPIGVSSCLLGERVRYDGDHKRDRFIADVLSRYVEYVPCCPEVSVGLGVPRPAIRLEASAAGPRAIQEGGHDLTAALAGCAAKTAARPLAGYLLKSRSPSCGLRVRIHGSARPLRGPGIFAGELRRRLPLLPLEEETRFREPARQDSFLARAFIYDRWHALGVKRASLPDFHRRYGVLALPYSAAAHRDLEAMVRAGSARPEDYLCRFLEALARPRDRLRVAQALAAAGINGTGFRKALADYRRGRMPLIALLARMET
jgi:uncharacterized protein YbbK (DUF523 family)/uncharacterized protein YbgA (DUF1722 family)